MKREFTRLPKTEDVAQLPELVELLEEHEKTFRAYRETKRGFEELKLERTRAHHEDGKSRVQAYRAGKEDPGPKAEAEVVERMNVLEDKAGVLENAYIQVESEMSSLLSRKRSQWLPRVRELVEEDDKEIAKLLSSLRAVMDKRQAHAGLLEWIAEPGPSCQKKVYAQGGLTEDTAYGILLGSVQGDGGPPSEDGSVRGIA